MAPHHALRAQAAALRREGLSLAQIARRLGVAKSVVGRWVADVPFSRHSPASLAEQLASRRDPHLYNQALALRRAGWSYSMIAAELGVAKSTLSGWLRDIAPAPASVQLAERVRAGQQRARRSRQLRQHVLEKQIQLDAGADIRARLGDQLSDSQLFLMGLVLYWAEGGRKQQVVTITNADPLVIRLFVAWLYCCLQVKLEQLRAEVHLYPDNDIEAAESYWSEVSGIPRSQFYKAQVDTRTGKRVSKRGLLKYGTLHVRVTGPGTRNVHRRIMGWIAGLGQYIE